MNDQTNPESTVDESKEAKEARVKATQYAVLSMPSNKERLSPQLRALVAAFERCAVDGFAFRSAVYALWAELCATTNGEKVFASYIHQLTSFGFIDRVGEAKAAPRKVLTADERKTKLRDMLAKLSDADRAEFIASL